jgi:hypothetical protein
MPSAVPAVVYAVLLVLHVLLGPLGAPALGAADVPPPGGVTRAVAGAPATHGTPHAQDADPAVPSATARNGRDVAGERHAPPGAVAHPQHDAADGPLRAGRTPAPTAHPPASERRADRHGVRAPPSPSGT